MTTSEQLLRSRSRPLDAGAASLIVLMCLLWGLNQVAIKFSLPDVPPFIQAVIRSTGGLLIVLGWVRLRGVALIARDGTLLPGIAAGLLFGLEFLLIYGGLRFTTASRASLFLYTAPFFVALGGRWLMPGEHLGPGQWAGLALCFVGLALAIGVPQANVGARMLLGDALLIGAGAAWGATTLVIKATRLNRISPEKTLVYQLVISIPVLAVAAALFQERVTAVPGPTALSWLLYQVAVVGVTFPFWFWLIQRYSATRVSAFTILTPLFGVAAGCLLLGEPFTLAFAAAVALVIAGLVLVNRPR
ncbi:MAG: DMT family transporter [Xanthobacteraceae bacterium]|nr:DMT family transporter [Xanthobacteraceae bacterium]